MPGAAELFGDLVEGLSLVAASADFAGVRDGALSPAVVGGDLDAGDREPADVLTGDAVAGAGVQSHSDSCAPGGALDGVRGRSEIVALEQPMNPGGTSPQVTREGEHGDAVIDQSAASLG